jgi:hypothetical protein
MTECRVHVKCVCACALVRTPFRLCVRLVVNQMRTFTWFGDYTIPSPFFLNSISIPYSLILFMTHVHRNKGTHTRAVAV